MKREEEEEEETKVDSSLKISYEAWPNTEEEEEGGREERQQTSSTATPLREVLLWSDEFHDTLITLTHINLTEEEEEKLFETLRRLELDFVYTAETWGRVIIEELFLPDEEKTIKPLNKGTLGGFKYEVRGVFFKFAHEIQYLVNASNSAKMSGNELRACNAIALYALETLECSLLPPLMALVDYRGFRLLAVSQLPIKGDETLIYGSNNAGRTIQKNNDIIFNQAIQKLAKHFNLSSHISATDNETIIYTATDVEGHYDRSRKRYYILDLARFFPPEAPPEDEEQQQVFIETCGNRQTITCSACSEFRKKLIANKTERMISMDDTFYEEKVIDNPRLYKQLRPFFVQREDCPALSSDAFSRFQSNKDGETCNQLVREESIRLRTVFVQRASIYLLHRDFESSFYPSLFNFSDFFHQRGLNIRLLGLLLNYIPISSSWYLIILIEMISRSFKSLLRRRFRALSRSAIHHSNLTYFRASDEDFQNEAAHLLSLLVMRFDSTTAKFSEIKKSEMEIVRMECFEFWEKLVNIMKMKFPGYYVNSQIVFCPVQLQQLVRSHLPKLFERATQTVGLQFNNNSNIQMNVFSSSVTPEIPLSVDLFQQLKPIVKHLHLIHLAEAKVLQIRAKREKNQRACEMLKKAKTKVEAILNQSPPTSSFFLIETYGEISYSLGIRFQLEGMEFELGNEALKNLIKAEGAFRQIATRKQIENKLQVHHKEKMISRMATSKVDDENFLSEASRNHLVLKAQQAKKYSNVTSSIVMQEFSHCSDFCCIGEDLLLAVGENDLRIWNISKKMIVSRIQTYHGIKCCSGRDDNFFFLTKDGKLYEGNLKSQIQEVTFSTNDQTAKCICYCKPDNLLYVVTTGGSLYIFENKKIFSTKQIKIMTEIIKNQEFVELHISSGNDLVVGCQTSVILLDRYLLVVNEKIDFSTKLSSMCVSHNGKRIVVGCYDSTVRIWTRANNNYHLFNGHLSSVLAVQFAGSNEDIIISSSSDRTLRIWQVELNVCLRILSGHLDSVLSLHFIENQKLLFTSSADSKIRLWRFDLIPFLPFLFEELQPGVRPMTPDDQVLLQNTLNNTARQDPNYKKKKTKLSPFFLFSSCV